MSSTIRHGCLSVMMLVGCLSVVANGQAGIVGEIGGRAQEVSGQPLVGVGISLVGVGQVEVDSAGAFRFVNVPPGTYFLRATKLGLQPVLKNVQLAQGERLTVEITMDASAQILSAVVVRGESSIIERGDPTGFARRMRTGQGVYVSGDEILRRGFTRTEHVFLGIPNVRVDTGGIILVARGVISYKDLLVRRPGANGSRDLQAYDCVGVQVFVDGALMPQPFNINNVQPQAIRGIELYRGPATTPPELRSPKTVCGTVAIWTR